MGKMVVLKPVVWNDNGYVRPAGFGAASGYAYNNGYGHEEWNGDETRIWQGNRVFHTETKKTMTRYAQTGNLGIILTARNNGDFFAVGAAVNVYLNTEDDRNAIADSLNLFEAWRQIWEVEAVRNIYHNNEAVFREHWFAEHRWVRWRCLPSHIQMFANPIRIVPNNLIPALPGNPPRMAIVMRQGSCQHIRPDQALAAISGALPDGHPIILWLNSGSFDPGIVAQNTRNAPPPVILA